MLDLLHATWPLLAMLFGLALPLAVLRLVSETGAD